MFGKRKVTKRVLTTHSREIRHLIEKGWRIESATWGWTILSKEQ